MNKCKANICDGSGYWSFKSTPYIINECPDCAGEQEARQMDAMDKLAHKR